MGQHNQETEDMIMEAVADDGRPLTCEIRTLTGETIGVLVLNTKTFSSGKVGYFGQGKMALEGDRYQTQAQLVRIQPKTPAPAPLSE